MRSPSLLLHRCARDVTQNALPIGHCAAEAAGAYGQRAAARALPV
jgi:sarcosine oxidase gamma subunit